MSLLQQHNSFSSDPKPSIPEQDNLYSNPEVGTSLQNGDTSINKSIVRRALESVIKERAVLYSRAPAWHKFNTVGAFVKLKDDTNNISISPLVCKGLSADFDGDCQIAHILALIPNNIIEKSITPDFNYLTYLNNNALINSMITQKLELPVFDRTKYSAVIMNLCDLPKGEHIQTKEGENGPIHFHDGNGIKVIALDETTLKPVWADVSYWSEHPDREIEIVNLEQDVQIVTDNHPRAVYGINPNNDSYKLERFTPTQALELGVVVPRYKTLNNLETTTENQETQYLSKINISEDWEVEANMDFGYFLGSMCGDGWVDKDWDRYGTLWYLADLEGNVAERNLSYLKKIIPDVHVNEHKQLLKDDPSRYGDTTKYTFGSKTKGRALTKFLREVLDGHGDENTAGSANKKVPSFLALTNEDCKLGFLAGLFDTDGSISISKPKAKTTTQLIAQIGSTSLRMLKDVQFLLSTLGIKSKITFSKTTTRGNAAWVLVCSSIDFYNKGARIVSRMCVPHKVKAFTEADKPDAGAACVVRLNKIPLLFSLRKEIMDVIPCPKLSDKLKRENLVKYNQVKALTTLKGQFREQKATIKGLITKDAITKFIQALDSLKEYFDQNKVNKLLSSENWNKLWQMYNDDNIQWLGILDVDYTGQKETGYDLTVPGYETFVNSDGVVLSNTINVHVPATSGAQSDLKKKLFPDKQIFSGRDNRNIVNPITQEFLLGLWNANRKPGNKYQFRTKEEALAAIKRGAIRLNDDVEITG